eukprot:409338-Amphidinium_carterae.1
MLGQSVRNLAAVDATAAVVASELAKSALSKIELLEGINIKHLTAEINELASRLLEPLDLFEAAPPQIRSLEPIFHETGDRPRKWAEQSETKQLRHKLNEERRAAGRQFRRDAMALQQLHSRKDTLRRVAREGERARVRTIMEKEKD